MSTPEPRLSVVMPCYDERDTIVEIVERVLASPHTRELIIVDDASTDGTRELLAGLDDDRIRVILQPHNQGKGAALRRGFREATSDFVVVQDADLEYDPAEYGVLLEPLLAGEADVVYGSRFQRGRPSRGSPLRHWAANRFLTRLSNMSTGLDLTDMETCYKALRSDVVRSLDLVENRFGVEPEITAKVAAGAWRLREVAISYNGRTHADGKKITWRDGLAAVRCIARYGRLARRQRRRRGA